ncbi:head-tail connector protein [Pediococcus acidilactici]|uniref:head-tail connector protein n=1 Tax=Pediococcus acidilactici TaxID=1254 RepID=UPI00232AE1CA|nr:head-tail connector protein [Pediococcus acidilactici]MDB8867677.1 head-tail connector protein [Pediococcus acidilactici]
MEDNLVNQLKTALRIDGNSEDNLLSSYVVAAKSFIKNAVTENDKFYAEESVKPLYEMATLALAGAYYTYRIALVDTQTYSVDLTLNSIIGQLRGIYAKHKFGEENHEKDSVQRV